MTVSLSLQFVYHKLMVIDLHQMNKRVLSVSLGVQKKILLFMSQILEYLSILYGDSIHKCCASVGKKEKHIASSRMVQYSWISIQLNDLDSKLHIYSKLLLYHQLGPQI